MKIQKINRLSSTEREALLQILSEIGERGEVSKYHQKEIKFTKKAKELQIKHHSSIEIIKKLRQKKYIPHT